MHKRSSLFTSRPETPPPVLTCPVCESPLIYWQTVVGGVRPQERWDFLECRSCGPFEYRHRTRRLRSIVA
jgi:transcription elongation factor Elf1